MSLKESIFGLDAKKVLEEYQLLCNKLYQEYVEEFSDDKVTRSLPHYYHNDSLVDILTLANRSLSIKSNGKKIDSTARKDLKIKFEAMSDDAYNSGYKICEECKKKENLYSNTTGPRSLNIAYSKHVAAAFLRDTYAELCNAVGIENKFKVNFAVEKDFKMLDNKMIRFNVDNYYKQYENFLTELQQREYWEIEQQRENKKGINDDLKKVNDNFAKPNLGVVLYYKLATCINIEEVINAKAQYDEMIKALDKLLDGAYDSLGETQNWDKNIKPYAEDQQRQLVNTRTGEVFYQPCYGIKSSIIAEVSRNMVKEVGNFNDKTIILTAIAQELAQAQGKYKFRNADELVSDVNEVVSILEKQKEFEMNTGVNGEDTKEDKQTNRTAVDQTAVNETIHNKYNRENCR